MRHFDTSEEIRRGYRVSAQMKKVWAVQLELTRKLLQVCKDHHLKIWADGGTLLGAVREKGYVPWDDDIDMIMPRGDYDKLLGLAAREFRPPFRFQSAYTEDKYPRAHAQLRMDGTTAILSADIFCKFHQGIFIDILVLDGVPDTRREVRAVEREAAPVMGTLIQYSSWHPAWKFFPHPPRFWRIRSLKARVRKAGFGNVFAKYDNLFKAYKFEEHDHVGNFTFLVGAVWEKRLRKEWYAETLLLPFEDMEMPVPAGYDAILTTLYGDYMRPVMAPSYHGGFAALDAERPYRSYLLKLRWRVLMEGEKRKWRHVFEKVKKVLHVSG